MAGISFGEWLKRQRQAAGLTQKQLASQIGCAAVTVRKIEGNERRPSAQIVERLASIFAIPPAERPALLRFGRGDWTQPPAKGNAMPPWRATPSPRSNLPAAVTALIGRDQELALVCGYLRDAGIRLVTLIGPPGIGKTRLSVETARAALNDFRDGVFFIALAPIDDPALVASIAVQTLGYVDKENQSALETLKRGIGDKHMLLVLDNCEHLINAASELASALLAECPQLKILATSRENLRISGEWQYAVPALRVPAESLSIDPEAAAQFPALTLFAERAHAVRPDFTLSMDNIRPVAAICAQLDGLPLAIELIASRIRLMSPQTLLKRMTHEFVLSADGMRAVSARHKTLGNAIGWSYNSLSPEEQRTFACLAVFSGGFALEAAESICAPAPAGKSIAELVTSLLDKSLLQHAPDARGEDRFTMLETIRQFALDCLRRSGDEAEMRDRHLSCFLELAENAEREMRGPRQVEWIERIDNEQCDFHAALEWSVSSHKTESALRMLCALGWPWEVRGHYGEALGWLDRIRSLPDVEGYPLIYARLLNHMGRYCWTQGKTPEAHSLLEKSQAILLNSGAAGERALAETLNWLGLSYLDVEGEVDHAKALLERGLELSRKWEDERGLALSTFHLGIVERELKHHDLARTLLEESLALFRQCGDLFFIARVSVNLGYLFLKQEIYDQAEYFFEQHLDIDRRLQFWTGIADGWFALGRLHRQTGEYEKATECHEECLFVCREHGLALGPYLDGGAGHSIDVGLISDRSS